VRSTGSDDSPPAAIALAARARMRRRYRGIGLTVMPTSGLHARRRVRSAASPRPQGFHPAPKQLIFALQSTTGRRFQALLGRSGAGIDFRRTWRTFPERDAPGMAGRRARAGSSSRSRAPCRHEFRDRLGHLRGNIACHAVSLRHAAFCALEHLLDLARRIVGSNRQADAAGRRQSPRASGSSCVGPSPPGSRARGCTLGAMAKRCHVGVPGSSAMVVLPADRTPISASRRTQATGLLVSRFSARSSVHCRSEIFRSSMEWSGRGVGDARAVGLL